ncbi:MAG: hypothetical protein ACRC8D_07190 [Aeromonas sp.]
MAFKVGDVVPVDVIRNPMGRDNWVVVEINALDGLDNLKARMVEVGFEPVHYVLVSKPTGRQRKSMSKLCMFGQRSGLFRDAF